MEAPRSQEESESGPHRTDEKSRAQRQASGHGRTVGQDAESDSDREVACESGWPRRNWPPRLGVMVLRPKPIQASLDQAAQSEKIEQRCQDVQDHDTFTSPATRLGSS